ncbi:hypothetical protein JOB18_019842 [Solea senegalensis]|uniref:Uncharacterized protein n=1 Tax=Solea senegalensis TaxID=28829 RepID=A0AAV6RNH8_SOLSE|nr:hypothetical protein JOB18_019842 [Solea senegalensis]
MQQRDTPGKDINHTVDGNGVHKCERQEEGNGSNKLTAAAAAAADMFHTDVFPQWTSQADESRNITGMRRRVGQNNLMTESSASLRLRVIERDTVVKVLHVRLFTIDSSLITL